MFLNIFEELKKEKGLNDSSFAKACNIPYQTVRGWTRQGKLPDYQGITKIADFFQVSTDYLLGRENDVGVININADLTPLQSELLTILNKLSEQDQNRVLGYAQALAK